jgi:HD-GYP domain-containing protein (c-di-GMP phosphodiesterase class II)
VTEKTHNTLKDNLVLEDPIHIAEDMLSSLMATIRKQQMYPEHHVAIKQATDQLYSLVKEIHSLKGSFVIGIVDGEVIFEDVRLKKLGESMQDTLKSLNDFNIDSLSFEEGVTFDGLSKFTTFLSNIDKVPKDKVNISDVLRHHGISHISMGRGSKKSSSSPSSLDNDSPLSDNIYESTTTVLYSIFESIRAKDVIDLDSAHSISENIIGTIQEEKDTLKVLASLRQSDNYSFTHSLNVSILNVIQGINLSFDQNLLKKASTAGLLHDIGKRSLPDDIVNKKEALTKKEQAILASHPVEGAKMLLSMPNIDPAVALVAYEHHQRYDLKGYPPVQNKKRLNPLSLITAISDTYDNLRNPHSGREEVLCYQAMAFMMKNSGSAFDPFLLKCFEELIGYYPSGTCVELDSGEIAVVIKSDSYDATRPQVRIVKSTPASPALRGKIVRLSEIDNMNRFRKSIKRVVPASEIDFDRDFYM